MLPASFAPMILKMILGKKILPKLNEAIASHIAKIWKLDQVVNYMELPNDADKLGEKNQEHITVMAGEIAELNTRLEKIELSSKKAKKSNGK
tara:strand:+ start:3996 stop:4271 length:276 start_codon:yes stop_codon:yes gene_type:complete